ncbi:hypothetical protein BDF20DRAFT_893344 [Mycotypha africana]|uniref:uncharacterized protein n=1 Tax=Mycotypha africana TaxID=64632 RepID=UPI0023009347|nr:uncharacterized protein BDF20DRAFT_893344 [Mycotypha africana]KAI8969122.1 hypothetical protein BDF20DRAFT_893344 [Mycotypha africana]
MMILEELKLPDVENTENYRRIPFQFTEELSSKNVYLKLPDTFSPVERMILQATGNLQRILSAYYNVPSHVKIVKNQRVPCKDTTHMQFDRRVQVFFQEKLAYEADSILKVKDKNVLELIEKHKYGLGQIFGHTHRSPDFVLHAIGRHGEAPGASFWRDYTLTIPDVLDCFVRETFVEGLLHPCNGSINAETKENAPGVIYFNNTSELFQ